MKIDYDRLFLQWFLLLGIYLAARFWIACRANDKTRDPDTSLSANAPAASSQGQPEIITCRQCGTSNRIPVNRAKMTARCGKCGIPL